MYFTDSHLHFDAFEKQGRVDEIIQTALQAEVKSMLAVGGSPEANSIALAVTKKYPGTVLASLGIDRTFTGQEYDEQFLIDQIKQNEVVAVGEIGLDYHYSAESKEEQKKLFSKMLHIAEDIQKPVIVHSRKAQKDTLALLAEYVKAWEDHTRPPGVLHCFTEDQAFAEALLNIGFLISFSGILSFKNAEAIRQLAKQISRDRILIETDSPYLAPVPHRGKENQPAYVIHVADVLAELLECTTTEVANFTTANAQKLFGLNTDMNKGDL